VAPPDEDDSPFKRDKKGVEPQELWKVKKNFIKKKAIK
jgi:hypothetical protein